MSIKLASIGYVPGPNYGHGRVFLDNLKRHPAKHEVILFSDHDYGDEINIRTSSPESVKGATKSNGRPSKFAVNNLCFFTSLRIAVKSNVSHFIALEDDVRVIGAGWDAQIFSEFFDSPKPAIIGGSPVVFDPANHSMQALEKFYAFADECRARGYTPPIYGGGKGSGDATGSTVFVNGAGGVYDVQAMLMLYPNVMDHGATHQLAVECEPWDLDLGRRLWAMFGPSAYDLVAHLPSVFSAFANTLTDPGQRIRLLHEGKARLVHQLKGTETA